MFFYGNSIQVTLIFLFKHDTIKENFHHCIQLFLESFRPAIDTLAAAMRHLGTTDFGDEEIGADDIRYMK